MLESQQTPTPGALQGEITPPSLPTLQNTALMSQLTPKRQTMLTAIALNLLSETILTDTELAKEIGVDRTSLSRARVDPTFNAALTAVMRDVIKGKADKPVENLFKLAEKDVKANEILLRIAEVYQPTSRNLNVNANISQSTPIGTPESAIESSCQKFIAIGYDLERYIAEITQVWTRLKAEGV